MTTQTTDRQLERLLRRVEWLKKELKVTKDKQQKYRIGLEIEKSEQRLDEYRAKVRGEV